jgi:hypothetical protein
MFAVMNIPQFVVLRRTDAVGLRWNATSGRVFAAGVARRRPEVAIHLSEFAAAEAFAEPQNDRVRKNRLSP